MGVSEGTVVQVDAKQVLVDLAGEVVPAALRGTLFEDLGTTKNPVAVGDRVRLDKDAEGPAVAEVLPRRNHLSRVASGHDPREQVLVANVDQLLVIGSVRQPGFSSNRTDRILAACEWHEVPTVVVLNKIDLAKRDEAAALEETYASVPVRVLRTSAKTGEGVEDLGELLRDRVSVLYGPSGAGKSTLINQLEPGLNLKEGRISSYWKQGRHTTTFSRLHPLSMGGAVVDTPGIRVFRLFDVSARELRDLFPDIHRLSQHCQFDDCSHDHEPGCALDRALDEGLIAPTRWSSYLEMLDELRADPRRSSDEEAP
jgi:ribosome biogenesis GTPase